MELCRMLIERNLQIYPDVRFAFIINDNDRKETFEVRLC